MRKILHLLQGSPEWCAHRNMPGRFNGSEIAAIMGLSSHTTRAEMLRRKATGIEPEYDAATLQRFADGHESEALARPLAEEIIGDDLSPLVMMDEFDGITLSVSLDGVTFGNSITFEHKRLNQRLAASLDAGVLPGEYHPQCESGLMVSGATRCLFMASKDGDASTARHIWYEPNNQLRKSIIAECKQFAIDLENYVPPAIAELPKAEVSIDLPALFVHAKGEITDSNMKAYGEALAIKLADVRAIQLVTDQDFSNAKASAAMLRDQCAKMRLTKEAMLSQTVTIGEAARMMDAWAEDMRLTALKLEKDVEREDAAKKAAIVAAAKTKYAEHIKALSARIGGYMPTTQPNFAEALKNKRSYTSMSEAVDTALRKAVFEADEVANKISSNWDLISENRRHLFPDFATVCTKQLDDFIALYMMRVDDEDKRVEAARLAAEARAEAKRQETEAPRSSDDGTPITIEDVRAAKERADLQWNMDQVILAATQGVVASPADTSLNTSANISAASLRYGPAEPVGEASRIAITGHALIVSGKRITDFLACLDMLPKEKEVLRENLLKWEKYRLAVEIKVAA